MFLTMYHKDPSNLENYINTVLDIEIRHTMLTGGMKNVSHITNHQITPLPGITSYVLTITCKKKSCN